MTTAQATTISDMLKQAEIVGSFTGADIRPATKDDGVYGDQPGAIYIAIGVNDGEYEHTGVSIIDPTGGILDNYESN